MDLAVSLQHEVDHLAGPAGSEQPASYLGVRFVLVVRGAVPWRDFEHVVDAGVLDQGSCGKPGDLVDDLRVDHDPVHVRYRPCSAMVTPASASRAAMSARISSPATLPVAGLPVAWMCAALARIRK